MRGQPVTNPTGIRPHVPDDEQKVSPVEFALLKQTVVNLRTETVPALRAENATLRADIVALETKVATLEDGRQRLAGVVWAASTISGLLTFVATVVTILQAMRS